MPPPAMTTSASNRVMNSNASAMRVSPARLHSAPNDPRKSHNRLRRLLVEIMQTRLPQRLHLPAEPRDVEGDKKTEEQRKEHRKRAFGQNVENRRRMVAQEIPAFLQ